MNITEAIELVNNQEYDLALKALDAIISSPTQDVQAYYWRSIAYLKLEKFGSALNDLNKAIEIYDEYANAYSQRGVVYFHLKRLDLALNDMNKAVELEPQNPYRYSSRAYIKGHLKETQSAIDDYKKAIELDPEDAIAHNNLGLLEEQLGYAAMSKKRFERADNLSINNEGELVKRDNTNTPSLDENFNIPNVSTTEYSKPSLKQVLKNTFTTKNGFKEYLNFVKGMFLK